MAIVKIEDKVIEEMMEIPQKFKSIKKVTPEIDGDIVVFHVNDIDISFSITKSELRDIFASI